MSGQHTQGRLEAVDTTILFRSDRGIIVGGINIAALPEPIANARRLAACWNACEGLETDDLEVVSIKRGIDLQKAELAAARALLAEVIKPHDDYVAAIKAAGDMPVENPMAERIRAFLKGDA